MTSKPEQDNIEDTERQQVKEEAVHQHRNWVRTTYACNNRCIFCLDGDVPPRGHRPAKEVFEEIEKGFQPGARLIVSGGEASIHPQFIDFVAHGKQIGYDWIQTISNGRMFAYKEFAQKAADAGLNEVTFSMHGHNSELHDTLTGIKGAFAQALRGMLNLIRDGRVVLNVDIVINGLNYKYLKEIVDFYMKLGIHEFDLLQIVPFGRAWWDEHRDKLFYDVEQAFPYINEGFKHAQQPENFIWTNRFPVEFLEGVEQLIQDPHKLYDEVHGRRDEFANFLKTGRPLQCYGERCKHCFIRPLCDVAMDTERRLRTHDFECLDIDLTGEMSPAPEIVQLALGETSVPEWRVKAKNAEQAEKWIAAAVASPERLILQLQDWNRFELVRFPGLVRLVVQNPDDLDRLMSLSLELEVIVDGNSAEGLLLRRQELSKHGKVILAFASVETLTEAQELPNPVEFFKHWADSGLLARGVTPCIHSAIEPEAPTLRLSTLNSKGKLDMPALTGAYIVKDYRSHSTRCQSCRLRQNCPGMHINTLRVHGFKILQPVK